MDEATEIARLRLFLALVASAETVDQLEPLPNIDFNILKGNSLIGLMHVNDEEFNARQSQGHLFRKSYRELLAEKNRLIDLYRHTGSYTDDLRSMRDDIETKKREAIETLDEILLSEFQKLGIKFEQATWDEAKKKEGKAKKRPLAIKDIEALEPFHWGYEFDEIINKRGGFDAIITNPPWEIFKPQAKEFFADYSDLVTVDKMTIKEFEKAQDKLMKTGEVREAWFEYKSRFPHANLYYRNSPHYANQVATDNGKRASVDLNLYKLFAEQCYNLLRKMGVCGIVIPSGIYNDLGSKQLREMLFTKTEITGLFCFENRKEIFEGVHRSFKFVVLTFEKGLETKLFPSAFMRHDVTELAQFPREHSLRLSVPFIRQTSPDSLSIFEFKNEVDIKIVEKALKFPLLGTRIDRTWDLYLNREFHMTDDSYLFKTKPTSGGLALYEGKMIHHFDHKFSEPRYWVEETQGRKALLKQTRDVGQLLDYQDYRIAFRRIARNTDKRTMISTVLPKNFFASESLTPSSGRRIGYREQLFLIGVLNSLVVDYCLRQRVSANINMFYVFQLPIPRLIEGDKEFKPVVERVARLICTAPEFDDLAREVGLRDHRDGVTDPAERARLRAELDGMIAHLYALTEEEFAYILTTFPLVEQSVKDAALDAYRELAPKPGDQEIAALIAKGESATLEFKSSARWDMKQNKADKLIEGIVVKTVAALLNSEGGALLLGVDDDRNVIGLANDYKLFGKKDSRDAYENFLTGLLLNNLGKDSAALISITFHELDGKDVCKVAAKKSPKPVFVKDQSGEHLYIRAGNSTRLLSTREAIDYCKMRWK